jgi:hypothetical protein
MVMDKDKLMRKKKGEEEEQNKRKREVEEKKLRDIQEMDKINRENRYRKADF